MIQPFGNAEKYHPKHSLMSESSWRAKELFNKHCTESTGARFITWKGFEKAIADLLREIDDGRA